MYFIEDIKALFEQHLFDDVIEMVFVILNI